MTKYIKIKENNESENFFFKGETLFCSILKKKFINFCSTIVCSLSTTKHFLINKVKLNYTFSTWKLINIVSLILLNLKLTGYLFVSKWYRCKLVLFFCVTSAYLMKILSFFLKNLEKARLKKFWVWFWFIIKDKPTRPSLIDTAV